MEKFELHTELKPAGDQPEAIAKLVDGLKSGEKHQTLLGVTGSGKTFTIANIISQSQKPTLVIAHNKTLAAQLTSEYRRFFPKAAVEYFVSYYDYYQPEAYLPNSDTYIEKEAQINDEIDRLRHAATQAILTRNDAIVVASVSCIYGIGNADEYQEAVLTLTIGQKITRDAILDKLIFLQYQRNDTTVSRGEFRARGESIDIVPADATYITQIRLDSEIVKEISQLDSVTRDVMRTLRTTSIYPARHFVAAPEKQAEVVASIQVELAGQLKQLKDSGQLLEADRLERRTNYDLEMIREVGYCSGIENYSRHFDGRAPGVPPTTLLDYFPDDFLLVIDESHVTVPQIAGMFNGDAARKEMLVRHGFRLPSAKDNRPLKFHEFEKKMPQTIYTSATPGAYELAHSKGVVEQIIRPTGIVDPEIIIKPAKNQVHDLYQRIEEKTDKSERVLVTTLTKKMSEDLTQHLEERGVKVRYLHSDIATMERIEILRDLRKGRFDVLVGVNLLREGLDLPEVSLVAILDADKEGFLRSETSLIQTIGRAARNVQGQVVLYADEMTGSLNRAISETERRRKIQLEYNQKHNITPTTISKNISSLAEEELTESIGLDKIEAELSETNLAAMIKQKERQMKLAAQELQFELAAILRDEAIKLKRMREKTGRDIE